MTECELEKKASRIAISLHISSYMAEPQDDISFTVLRLSGDTDATKP